MTAYPSAFCARIFGVYSERNEKNASYTERAGKIDDTLRR